MSSEKTDIEFVGGLIVKPPREGAPDFVKATLSFKRLEAIAWLQAQTGDWVNADVKEAKSGKWYAARDDWKPNEGGTSGSGSRGGAPQHERPQRAGSAPVDDFQSDDIPFASNRSTF